MTTMVKVWTETIFIGQNSLIGPGDSDSGDIHDIHHDDDIHANFIQL